MADQVNLSVRSELGKIIEELGRVRDAAQSVSDSLGETGKDVAEDLNKKVKQTETFFTKLRDFGRRTSDQLKKDFKSLLALNAVTESLKLSNQFKGSIAETVSLSDKIRKLGSTFGIAASEFSSFQNMLTKGLGQIGLSSESATNALDGLSETPVRGQKNLTEYAKAAGMLASFGGQKGQEGAIAKGLASVINARGGNVNDVNQMGQLADEVKRVRIATGKGPAEVLQAMQDMFSGMAVDMRKKIGPRGMANLAAASQVAGPNSTKFLEELLSKSPIQRQALEAQGFKGIFGDNGLDIEKFRKASAGVMGRIGGDPRLAAQTLGISEEAAEGFVRLAQSLDEVKAAQERVANSNTSLEDSYKQSMGMGEAFRASINRVKRLFAEPISAATQGITGMLGKASGSDLGAGAVVAGGGVLAALLAGYGLRGIGGAVGGLAGTVGKSAGIEALTGQKVQPVYVVNASDIAAGGALGGIAGAGGGAAGMLSKLGPIAAIAAAGAGGAWLGGQIEKTETGAKMYDRLADALLALTDKLGITGYGGKPVVKVELNKRELREAKQPTRGASYGP